MIEQGLNYADSTIKEMKNFIEIKVENLELSEEKKLFSKIHQEKAKGQTPTQML